MDKIVYSIDEPTEDCLNTIIKEVDKKGDSMILITKDRSEIAALVNKAFGNGEGTYHYYSLKGTILEGAYKDHLFEIEYYPAQHRSTITIFF